MKRSELVDLLEEYIVSVSGDCEGEDILNIIEEAGMLPPDRALCHPEFKYKDHTWEKE